jgi:hypothetical protein
MIFSSPRRKGAKEKPSMKNHLLASYLVEFNELYWRRPKDRRRVRREITAGLVTLGISMGAAIFLGMVC